MRTKAKIREPDIYQKCNKKNWDGQVRKWRRALHSYDPISSVDNLPESIQKVVKEFL